MRKKLLGCLGILLILGIVVITATVILWHRTFPIPAFVVDRVKGAVRSQFGIDLRFSGSEFRGKPGRVEIASFSFSSPDCKPFLTGRNILVEMGNLESLWDAYSSGAPVDAVTAEGLFCDWTAPFPSSTGESAATTKVPPLNHLVAETCTFKFWMGEATLSEIRCDIDQKTKVGTFQGHLTKNILGGEAFASGTYDFATGMSRISLTWKRLKLEPLQQLLLLSLMTGAPEVSGDLDCHLLWEGNLKERLKSPLSNLFALARDELFGALHVSHAKTRLREVPLTFTATLEKPRGNNVELRAEGKVASGTITVQVRGSLDAEALGTLQYSIEGVDVHPDSRVLTSLGFSSSPVSIERLTFSSQGVVQNGRLETATGSATLREMQYRGFPSSKVEMSWEAACGQLVASIDADLLAGHLHLAASTPLSLDEGKQIVVQGTLARAQIASLAGLLPFKCEGTIGSDFLVSIPRLDYLEAEYHGSILVEQPRIVSFPARNFSGEFTGKGKNGALKNAHILFANGGFFRLKGTLSPAECRGSYVLRNLPLSLFGRDPQQLEGDVSCDGTFSGTFPNLEIDGNAWSQKILIGSQEFIPLKAQVAFAKGLLRIASLSGTLKEGGMVDGHAAIRLSDGDLRDLEVGLTGANLVFLKKFRQDFFERYPLVGFVDGKLKKRSGISPDPRDLGSGRMQPGRAGSYQGLAQRQRPAQVDFSLSGKNLLVASETVSSFHIAGDTDGKQVEINDTLFRVFGGDLKFTGRYAPSAGFAGTLNATQIDLAHIENSRKAVSSLTGELSCMGQIDWTEERKKGSLVFNAKNLSVNDLFLGDAQGQAEVNPEALHIVQADLPMLGILGSGTLHLQGRKRYEASLRFADTDLSRFATSVGLPAQRQGTAVVGGVVSIRGDSLSEPPSEALCTLEKLAIRSENLFTRSRAPLSFLYRNGTFSFPSASLQLGQGRFDMAGTCSIHGPSDVTFSAKGISISPLMRLLDYPSSGIDGDLSANGAIEGIYPNLSFGGSVSVASLSHDGKIIPKIFAKVHLDVHRFKIDEGGITFPRNRIAVSGIYPFSGGNSPGDFDFSIQIASGPLDDLPTYFPGYVKRAQGNMYGAIRLFGTTKSPRMTGDAKIVAREFRFAGMSESLRDVQLGLTTKDGTVFLSPARAVLGKGLLQGNGAVQFGDGSGSMTVRLSGNNLDFSMAGFEVRKARLEFNASGSLSEPILRGSLMIPQGKCTLSENLFKNRTAKRTLPFKSLDYAFDIIVPRNFWVKNSMLNAEMKGKMALSGDLNTFHLGGGFETLRGWILFQRHKFTIDTGEIRFGEHDGTIDPSVYFKSVTTIQTTQIFLTVQGLLSSFTPRIYSSPPMNEGDLIALLTLGRTKSEALAADPKSLLENEILDGLKNAYLSGLLSSTLSSALNLDELYVGSLFDRTKGATRSFLHIGKYIGNNIFIAYEGTLAKDDSPKTYIIEYKLPKSFSIELRTEKPSNDSRIGVKYDWKF